MRKKFYTHHEVIIKLKEKYQPKRWDRLLRKYSKCSSSAGEAEGQYNRLSRYLRYKRLDEEIEDQYLQKQP